MSSYKIKKKGNTKLKIEYDEETAMAFLDENVRSDLVIEYTEQFYNSSEQKGKRMSGVEMKESAETSYGIKVTDVQITNEDGERSIGKPIGQYITVEAVSLPGGDDDYHQAVTGVLMAQLRKLLPDIENQKVLVAGIGNRDITPDALGPLVAEHLFITRHLFEQYGKNSDIVRGLGNVSAVIPGVMAQTGMETAEILHGLVREIRPDVLIAIDALAARSIRRLVTTIQLTDTGIHPGAGIGIRRYCLTKEVLGIPVIAIGMPTVIDAATIVADTMESLIGVLNKSPVLQKAVRATEEFDHEEKYLLMRELMEPQMTNLFVTPKDIDEAVSRISYTISEAINSLCHHV